MAKRYPAKAPAHKGQPAQKGGAQAPKAGKIHGKNAARGSRVRLFLVRLAVALFAPSNDLFVRVCAGRGHSGHALEPGIRQFPDAHGSGQR